MYSFTCKPFGNTITSLCIRLLGYIAKLMFLCLQMLLFNVLCKYVYK